MKKFISLVLVLLFLAGATVWAGQDSSSSTDSPSRHHSRQKHSKKKKSKKKKGKKKKGSKGGNKSEVKMETGIGKSDVTLDLKGK
jgi:Ni/Co efflux regulator RcnB